MSVGGGAEEALVEDEDDAVVMRVDAEDADADSEEEDDDTPLAIS